MRALLVGRKQLQAKLRDVELSIRGLLRGFGLKVGEVSKGQFAARIRELVAGHDDAGGGHRRDAAAREALQDGVHAPAPGACWRSCGPTRSAGG